MKSNAKFVAICLVVVFVLALMCGVLVACNENPETPLNPDQNETPNLGGDDDTPLNPETPDVSGDDEDTPEIGSIASFISDEDLEHIVGYIATEGAKDGQSATVYIVSEDIKYSMEDEYDAAFGVRSMYVSISLCKSGEEDESYNTIYILDGESQAKAYIETLPEEIKAQAKQEGRYIYIEDEEGFFKNTVFKASLPSDFSKTRLDFIKECAKLGGVSCDLSISIETNYIWDQEEDPETNEGMYMYLQYEGTNCACIYSYGKINEPYTDERIENDLKGCTEDSYVDTTRESGYVFAKRNDKTGLFYNDTFVDIGEDRILGLEVANYHYDKNTSKELVIPATDGDKKVIKAGITESNLVSITLSEGILQMGDFHSNDELTTLSLPKSIKILARSPFINSSKLTTIKYAGTTDEWNDLVEANHLNISEDWCKYSNWNSATQQSVQKTISFTVQCSNGSISYPTAA